MAPEDDEHDTHVAQRLANERAQAEGRPLPFPNMWDRLDPTKVRRDASPEELMASVLAFRELCPPKRPKTHRLLIWTS